MKRLEQHIKHNPLLVVGIIFALVVLGSLVYAYLRIFSLTNKLGELQFQLASTTETFRDETWHLAQDLSGLTQKTTTLSETLNTAEENIQNTKKNIETVESQVGGVTQTVGKISSTVGTLEKLSKTDPELLQKYSKVFFLSEHYAPERLLEVDKIYLYSESRPESIHALVWPHLKELLDAAKKENAILYVKSAYRSFDEQAHLKSAYTVVYGAGTANQFSADQGYSEHQLGTAVDFISTGQGGQLAGFDETGGYQWMLRNAYRYGFILSYPKNNQYYIFEPWHWRFVGTALAEKLHQDNKYFYDLDQREIDQYLANIFD